MQDDATRWNERYAGIEASAPRPPDALVAGGLLDVAAARVTGGQVLDVACGLGPVARWAAGLGAQVVALDVSSVAIEALRSVPEADRIDARLVDLDDGLPDGLGVFDLVVCQRFRDRSLIASLPDVVAPGGLLVVTVLSEVGADSPGPFHAPRGELAELLADPGRDWDERWASEAGGEASVVLQRPERSS